jgi:hypothetical protein
MVFLSLLQQILGQYLDFIKTPIFQILSNPNIGCLPIIRRYTVKSLIARICPFAACFMLASYLVYSLNLKIRAIFSSETSVDIHRAKRCYMLEYKTFFENKKEERVYKRRDHKDIYFFRFNYLYPKLHDIKYFDDLWTMLYKVFGRKWSLSKRGIILTFAWTDRTKPWEASVTITKIPVRTQPKTSRTNPQRCPYTILLGTHSHINLLGKHIQKTRALCWNITSTLSSCKKL